MDGRFMKHVTIASVFLFGIGWCWLLYYTSTFTLSDLRRRLSGTLIYFALDCTEHVVLMSNGQDPTVVGLGS